MSATQLRIGITGCGFAARAHLGRMLALDGVAVVGCADPDATASATLAGAVPGGTARPYRDHVELLREAKPDVLAIFTPHLAHYRAAMDALQAGCHVFVEKPLSTNVQEAVDIVNVARGRNRLVGVGHQYRLAPSLIEARHRITQGKLGRLRLVTAALALPWLASHGGKENSWRFDPKVSGGGILADAGDHLVDALLWTTGAEAKEVAGFQSRLESGLDLVTAAAIRLGDELVASLTLSGISPGSLFEITYFGENGRLRATDRVLVEEIGTEPATEVKLDQQFESIDSNFVAAIRKGGACCCPADQALETVRLLEALARSAATGQVVRLR